MNQKERIIWLIKYLLKEQKQYKKLIIPSDEESQNKLLRSLFNVRPPYPVSEEFLKIQDEYLTQFNKDRGITDVATLKPTKADERLYIWQGDITTLKCDAIVNAANSKMLGCFQPLHDCIDNFIHTYAGVQLRAKCHEIMQKQGHEEATGQAKITPAYNLPSKYVIHTVGPIIHQQVTEKDKELLKSSYHSCLEVAVANGVESIAFCCISTGAFRFPKMLAAEIAVKTVRDFLKESTFIKQVIFNVFKDEDLNIYNKLLNI
ncbi:MULTISPECIES: protein-ADP-ribose hydrolase [Clostridium]|uniref:O-acetyl-ADP-ribose deacetylase n=1 Tax=Clostridium colicanis DSM 13634 TaxID=1121305 RepID=A0A151AM33_9CLOT|nr:MULTISPECIES: protein-ADP-ribose hydrolase [Clostridium]KYH28590.1 O-acetyl-ADP-ribose deacetylase [Clostridium colicanis DSM 13634]MBE6042882.1 protein-ADP-ribose hydrolase [Clostridium thermopalmarium]